MKLKNMKLLTATLKLETGLHIGSGDTAMSIGGVDSQVIRNPQTKLPYIPGSSIKGKMRTMLEWRAGVVGPSNGKPLSYKVYQSLSEGVGKTQGLKILQLFGTSGGDQLDMEDAAKLGITRLSFWDCNLDENWLSENELTMEEKSENSIDRSQGTAESPRFIERVPAGAEFKFKLSIKDLETDDDSFLATVLEGLKLLELDGIGGSGSRGYGKIAFLNVKLDEQDLTQRFSDIKPFEQV